MMWSTPYPERVFWLDFFDKNPQPTLSIGIVTSENDHLGRKIIPTNEIQIAFGDSENLYKEIRNISINSARSISHRIIEMCDAAEKEPPNAT